MSALRAFVSVVTLVLSASATASAQTTALRFARLVGGSGQVLTDAVVVIQGDRITSVGRGTAAVPNDARVPTIDHNRYYAEYHEQFGYTPAQVAALDSFRLRNVETARRAWKAHVRFAMGSDAVFTMFGQNTRELGWLTQRGG